MRRVWWGFPSVLAVPLAVGAVAWACVPRGELTLSQQQGAPGTVVTATAKGFPNNIPVEVRWNDVVKGPVLASGTGPEFSTTITIPSAPSGVYTVIAATADEHATHSAAPASFEVVGGADPVPTPTPSPTLPDVDPFAPQPGPGGKVITGTDGADRLVGTAARDVIRCGAGDDVVSGGGGDDYIDCGAGRDRVDGGAGDDEVLADDGNDTLAGGSGADDLSGGGGADKLAGGAGRDRLSGGGGVDTLRGNAGRDRLSGGAGRDILYRDGADRLVRGPGRDRVRR